MSQKESASKHVFFIYGSDEFVVKKRAREVFDQWLNDVKGIDHEIIDGFCKDTSEALLAINKLKQAILTPSLFGLEKIVWLKDCNFFGIDRTGESKTVNEALAELSDLLVKTDLTGIRLLVTASNVAKTRTIVKTLERIANVEVLDSWTSADKDWKQKASVWAYEQIRQAGKQIDDDALELLVERAGVSMRTLSLEIEKLILYLADKNFIAIKDVESVVSRTHNVEAFALGEALGERDLSKALNALQDVLWGLKTDTQKSEIGVLFGLISKIRCLLLAKALIKSGQISQTLNYKKFSEEAESALIKIFPPDTSINLLPQSLYPLFKATNQADNYKLEELIKAMETLLDVNIALVTSSADPSFLLQKALISIIQD